MRARTPLVCLAVGLGIVACLPKPDQDFEDFSKRANALPVVDAGGGSFEAAAPPTEAVTGLYYGACLCQLAFSQTNLVFNFLVNTSFVPDPAGGGKLSLKLQPLKLASDGKHPPDVVSSAGIVGDVKDFEATVDNVAAADGRFTMELATTTVPGDANPITGRNVVIENSKLTGFFAKERFCARLNGDVVQPIQLTLDPPQNICEFFPIKEGDKTPVLTNDQFQPGSCPF